MELMNHHNNPNYVEPPECFKCGGDLAPRPRDECEFVCDRCGDVENMEPDCE